MNRSEPIPIPDELIKETLPTGDFHLQEERRLFYVGLTRAKDKLYLTAANYYGEAKRAKKLSPFIFETLGDNAISSEQSGTNNQLSFSTQKTKIPQTKNKLHIDYLSYSQIQSFQICPLHYKLRYILGLPTPPTAALSFGSSIHQTLYNYYKKPTDIIKLLKSNWINLGYLDKTHEKKMYKRGEKYLRGYLDKSFNKKTKTVSLELPFVIPLNQKGEKSLKIGGKIDRVDEIAKDEIEIIDYKTSVKIPTEKDLQKNLQLDFYAIAANNLYPNKKVKLSMYYFEEQKKLSITKSKSDLEIAKKIIFDLRNKIINSDFKCSGHMFCSACEYAQFCRISKKSL